MIMTKHEELNALKHERNLYRARPREEAGRLERIWEVTRKIQKIETELLNAFLAPARKALGYEVL